MPDDPPARYRAPREGEPAGLVPSRLGETEANLRAILENTQDLIFSLGTDRKVLTCNSAFARKAREVMHVDVAPGSELLGVRAEHDSWWAPRLERAYLGERVFDSFPFELTGGTAWYEVAIHPIVDGDRVAGVSCFMRDVTQQREALRAAEESETRYRSLVEVIPAGVFVHRDGELLYANPEGLRMFQVPEGMDVSGHRIEDRVHPDDLGRVAERVRQIATEGVTPELTDARFLRMDGGDLPVVTTGIPFAWEGRPAVLSIALDASGRARAEQALRDSEREKAAILHSISDHVVYKDPDRRVIWCNKAFAEYIGEPPDALAGRFCPHQDKARCLDCPVEESLHLAAPVAREVRCEDDSVWAVRAYPVTDEKGAVAGVVEISRDVTTLRRAEEERWLAGQRHNLHIERTPLAVIEWDPELRVVDWNPAAEAIFGYSRAEALGRHATFILPEAARPGADAVWSALLDATGGERATLENVRRDGEPLVCDWYNTPLTGEDGSVTGVASLVLDITRQRAAEEDQRKLRDGMERTQRLESLGVLAGGIAHDFNNILSPILGFTELLMAGAAEGSTERDWLRQVNAAALRARDLVAQILTFSRKGESTRPEARLQPIVKETLRLIRASLPATIEITQSIDPACGPAAVDPSQFHQVVMNLCANAGYAMGDEGGSLTVVFGEADVDEALAVRLGCQGAGRYARLTVADTGCGMDAETLRRVFEPFFTTKPQGEGTGLGLSTVHGIVQSFGGGISAYSEVGRGTTFSVFLPLAAVAEERAAAVAHDLAAGHEHILVVDDEPALAAMASEMLRTLGYRVTAHTDSREALRAFREHPDAFQLVVTDQTMPHLTGSQLAASAQFLRPELPVLIITGYGAELRDGHVAGDEPAVLTKPYSLRDLSAAVRALLDGARSPGA
jgi:PAS domain S-box-containing protein